MDISPDKQNIDTLFASTTYYIDFYQREYKWNRDPVERLLDDIFFKFNLEYSSREHEELIPSKEVVTAYYPWYYLNTYVTNVIEGKVYVVDGQQRLTTLTLILLKLYHMTKQYDSELMPWVERKIIGYSGPKKEFWMNHVKHISTLEGLLKSDEDLKKIPAKSGLGAENILANYAVISKWLDDDIRSKQKLETFIFYFLYRLVLINLTVEQTNVPMVFEVINDRGVKLKPYEILKGKLLGLVDKIDLDRLALNELWEAKVQAINLQNENEIDFFFWSFIRARYTDNKADFNKVSESNYHRVIFTDDFNKKLKLKNNPGAIKHFLQNEFTYYSDLYIRILTAYNQLDPKYPHVYYNQLNDQDTQFMLFMSCCRLNDEQEEEKIMTISAEMDRLFSLLRLQRAYDSNRFNDIVWEIIIKIRDADVTAYRYIFDTYLIKELNYHNEVNTIDKAFSYLYFKDITGKDLPSRFLRYFYARIEEFLAVGMKLKMKHTFSDLVTKTGSVNGFHIEHIIADNDENFALFDEDEELFYRERNRLGGLLLLKGRDNQSSNDEVYTNKLRSYANTLYWNETLRADTYKSKLDLLELIRAHQLNMRAIPSKFGPDEIEERHKLLAQIVQIIWN
ncbi:DUF262 domain-containing protein [Chitinophaga agrisoli]|uniref:DUF262 domain-containing protein n=1 Tax=Chitinophaga agrisoli TaxID=2607653 RepID=A0A5B2VJH8_9BACT|nr:DUF262 domain-containing protein [Chitinophaga agrisoli]KAA2238808.1 DUF262 domain-containing protein [Chitinophaga agrisoli]